MMNRAWSWSRPRQAAELLAPQDAYALWAPSYASRPHNRLMEIEQAVIESRLPDLAGRDALDAGCGTGRYLGLLTARGATATGVDLSLPMLGQAQAVSRRLVRAHVGALPFASRSFDLVVSGLALGDVPHLAPAIAELARVLRPGGRLIYSVVHPWGAEKGWSRTFEASGRQWAIAGFWHSLDEHRSACAAAGLTIGAWLEPPLDGFDDPVALVVEATR
jgi:malonyl-CoA O-methyltransferase